MELTCSNGARYSTVSGFIAHLREVHGFDAIGAEGLATLAAAGLNIAWDTAIWTDDHELIAIQVQMPV